MPILLKGVKTHMKTVAVVKPGSIKDPDPEKRGIVQVMDWPEPKVGPKDVKIKVAYCAICGSDPHVIENIFGRTVPYGLGHEVSGVVAELGPEARVKGLKVGDKVAGNFLRACGACYYCQNGQPQFCQNVIDEGRSPGMAEYVVWDESQVWKIPDDMPLRKACMLEPVSIAVRIADRAELKPGQRVAIQGGGPIGLLCVQMLKMRGATSLTLIEPIAARRELAKAFGADYTLDPSSCNVVEECGKITNGLGYDVVVEASGFAPASRIPMDIAAFDARLLYIAMFPEGYEMPVNLTDVFHNRNLTLTATKVAPYCFPRAVQILPRMELEPFVQVSFPIDRAVEAFQAHASGKHPKVLICCNQDLADL
jgi:(R,R)-butanediol dehydrogenase/meso-butanediol dehydrogenase/diacetyl reductase/L-iditol 2-dehydrogenase